MTEPTSSSTELQSAAEAADEIGLLDILFVLAENKKLIVGLPAIVAVLAAVWSLFMTNIYTATAKILPPQQSQSTAASILGQLGGLAGAAGGALGIRAPNDLYIGMLKSRTVADNLIARFDLKKVYDQPNATQTRKILDGVSNIFSGKDAFIVIEVDDQEPARAAAIANGYIEELIKLTQTLAVTEASQRRLFYEKQVALASKELVSAELALKKAQEETGIIKLDDQGKAIVEAFVRLRAEIAAKEVELGAMRTFATPQNPVVVRVENELASMRQQLAAMEKKREGASQVDLLVPTGQVPTAGLEYVRRMREVKYRETLFELLGKQYEIAKIEEAKDTSIIQVLDAAVVPEMRSKPKRRQNVVFSAIVALFVAVVVAFGRAAIAGVRKDPATAARMAALRHAFMWKRG